MKPKKIVKLIDKLRNHLYRLDMRVQEIEALITRDEPTLMTNSEFQKIATPFDDDEPLEIPEVTK